MGKILLFGRAVRKRAAKEGIDLNYFGMARDYIQERMEHEGLDSSKLNDQDVLDWMIKSKATPKQLEVAQEVGKVMAILNDPKDVA